MSHLFLKVNVQPGRLDGIPGACHGVTRGWEEALLCSHHDSRRDGPPMEDRGTRRHCLGAALTPVPIYSLEKAGPCAIPWAWLPNVRPSPRTGSLPGQPSSYLQWKCVVFCP